MTRGERFVWLGVECSPASGCPGIWPPVDSGFEAVACITCTPFPGCRARVQQQNVDTQKFAARAHRAGENYPAVGG